MIFILPTAAIAQDSCWSGLTDIFSVQDYDVAKVETGYSSGMRLVVTLFNNEERGIRMVDGSIVFQDVLDRDILRVGIDPDQKIDSGGTVIQTGVYTNLRLLDVSKEDVLVTTCIRGLVYADGEVFKAVEK
ncbi:MAG: hypothetical protein JKY41_01160 [Rhodobacteraceae bacterium]|nr:hypothetical protein [Paracoccaceae bacterium]